MSDVLSSPFENVQSEASSKGSGTEGNEFSTESPFTQSARVGGTVPGTYDHNACPEFNKPHTLDSRTIRLKFFESMPGSASGVPLDSPFEDVIAPKTSTY